MKLTRRQTKRIACLLSNFAPQTVHRLLNRFDEPARRAIAKQMQPNEPISEAERNELLESFGEFLHFDPGAVSRNYSDRSARTENTIHFETILEFDDQALDVILRKAPKELTMAVLCCSPGRFVNRVLARLSPSEADSVALQISESPQINLNQLLHIQRRYCRFVSQLITDGQLHPPRPSKPF